MDELTSITADDLATSHESFSAERVNSVAKNAVTANGIRAAARRPEGVAGNALGFDIEVTQGERCDQERSGRCWMFASLNTMRYRVIKKYNLKTFELSQAYPLFWDKLEKSNWFFENILDTLGEPLDGRLVSFLLTDPIGDGGQWDMFRSLVKKYGVVPKEAMPETACSRNTGDMDRYLTRYLRGAAKRLRQSHVTGVGMDDLRSMKKEMMDEVYHLLAICLGEPPASFPVRLRDKDDKLALVGTFTPKEFFSAAVDMDVDAYISLISAPTADKPYHQTYTVRLLGNVVGGKPVKHLNLTMDEFKAAIIAQMQAGKVVWFGSDVGKFGERERGVWDDQCFDMELLTGLNLTISKADALDYGFSAMNHAMVLTGVQLEDGRPVRWKIENSWGDTNGEKGYYVCSDSWFDQYVFQAAVEREYLGDLAALADQTPAVLEPWDPMGTLAD